MTLLSTSIFLIEIATCVMWPPPMPKLIDITCGSNYYFTNISDNWFKMPLNSKQSIQFSTCNSSFDTVIKIFDSNQNRISDPYCSNNNDCGKCNHTNNEEYTVLNMRPDVYYIQISANHNNDSRITSELQELHITVKYLNAYFVNKKCVHMCQQQCYSNIDKAIQDLNNSINTIYIPSGQHIINKPIEIHNSNITLWGYSSNTTFITIYSNMFIHCTHCIFILVHTTINESPLFVSEFSGTSTISIQNVNVFHSVAKWIFHHSSNIVAQNCIFMHSNLSFNIYDDTNITFMSSQFHENYIINESLFQIKDNVMVTFDNTVISSHYIDVYSFFHIYDIYDIILILFNSQIYDNEFNSNGLIVIESTQQQSLYISIYNCTIFNNYGFVGSVLYVTNDEYYDHNGTFIEISSSTFFNNQAKTNVENSYIYIDSSVFSACFSMYTGGCVSANDSSVIITKTIFEHSRSNIEGGAVAIISSNIINMSKDLCVILKNNTYLNNSANSFGGAIYIKGYNTYGNCISIVHNTFQSNTAEYGNSMYLNMINMLSNQAFILELRGN